MEYYTSNTPTQQQPSKASEHPLPLDITGGNAPATKADIARLGDRIAEEVWPIKNMNLWPVLVACLLASLLGAGTILIPMKIWPEQTTRALRLPAATDTRLVTLSNIGAVIRVKSVEGVIYVSFDGPVQPAVGQTERGKSYFYFQP